MTRLPQALCAALLALGAAAAPAAARSLTPNAQELRLAIATAPPPAGRGADGVGATIDGWLERIRLDPACEGEACGTAHRWPTFLALCVAGVVGLGWALRRVGGRAL